MCVWALKLFTTVCVEIVFVVNGVKLITMKIFIMGVAFLNI